MHKIKYDSIEVSIDDYGFFNVKFYYKNNCVYFLNGQRLFHMGDTIKMDNIEGFIPVTIRGE